VISRVAFICDCFIRVDDFSIETRRSDPPMFAAPAGSFPAYHCDTALVSIVTST